jgi:hypothetical protein
MSKKSIRSFGTSFFPVLSYDNIIYFYNFHPSFPYLNFNTAASPLLPISRTPTSRETHITGDAHRSPIRGTNDFVTYGCRAHTSVATMKSAIEEHLSPSVAEPPLGRVGPEPPVILRL